MLYLNDQDIKEFRHDWEKNIHAIEAAVKCIKEQDYVQPVKPYLRYRDMKNRIIAMPAFAGGSINMSGIKWIASFPGNIQHNVPRAHCVVILNDPDTGIPIGILNSGSISAIRTASVSGLMAKRYIESRKLENIKLGVVGFGPIGQYHLEMCSQLLDGKIAEISLFDIKGVDTTKVPYGINEKVRVVDSWEGAYSDADIFITCTASSYRYINLRPKRGSLHLNVSLRDYTTDVFPWFSGAVVVDNWEEVCRENTDIEIFHKERNLQKADVTKIEEVVFSNYFDIIKTDQAILFSPMGMAIFDLAISQYYLNLAINSQVGITI